jgi:hypothetical protein
MICRCSVHCVSRPVQDVRINVQAVSFDMQDVRADVHGIIA